LFPRGIPPASDFPMTLESEHFIVYFGVRNPVDGKGLGCEGVRDRMVVLTYLDALEALYDIMISRPWNREAPVVDKSGKTRVYICNSEPFTAEDSFADTNPPGKRVPYIVLPSRNSEPTSQAELHRAIAEAVHEATHVFNYRERPLYEPISAAWEWFDEGMAVFLETVVASGNPDYFRFIINWIDMPELSLDDPRGKYQAGMFVRYLSKRIGLEFINDVWMNSKKKEKPLEALERILPKYKKGLKLVSSSPYKPDLFASGYCMEPYFLWDHESAGHAPDVFMRYGERAVCASNILRPQQPLVTKGVLNHLACSYHRYYLKGNISSINFQLTTTALADGTTPLKAEITIATPNKQRHPQVITLVPVQSVATGGEIALSADLTIADPDDIDHIILVVSNCGVRADSDEDIEHDDKIGYTVQVSPL